MGGLREILERPTGSNKTIKIENEDMAKDTAKIEGAVSLRKLLNESEKVGAQKQNEEGNKEVDNEKEKTLDQKVIINNESSINVKDGYVADNETSNKQKDSKEAKEETKPT